MMGGREMRGEEELNKLKKFPLQYPRYPPPTPLKKLIKLKKFAKEKTVDELNVVWMSQIEPGKPRITVKVTRRAVTLRGDRIPYPQGYVIDLRRIDSPIKLLHWVRHLAEKTWMGRLEMRLFISTVAEYFGWELNSSARPTRSTLPQEDADR
jgi:hypothetical protein